MRIAVLMIAATLVLAGCSTVPEDSETTATGNSIQATEEQTPESTDNGPAPAAESPEPETQEALEPVEQPSGTDAALEETTQEGLPQDSVGELQRTPESVSPPAQDSLQQLINSVPSQDLASLKEHFLSLDEGARSIAPFPMAYQIGPTAVPEKVEIVVNRFSEKLKLFQLLGLQSLDQDWVLVSEKDYQWWVEYRLQQDPDFPIELWNAELNELGHCGLSSNVFCGAGNYVNGKNYQDNVVGTRFTDRGLDYVARHEAAHFYQAVFGYGGRCWFAEGQATFFETYLETSSRSRAQVIQTLRLSPSNVAESSEERFFELLESDRVCQPDYRVAYDLGMLVFEYLYMNFSLVEIHDLMVSSSRGSWDQAVAETLGVNAKDLTRAIAGYLFAELN